MFPATCPLKRTVRLMFVLSLRILAQCAMKASRSSGCPDVKAAIQFASGSRCCSKKIGRSSSRNSRNATSSLMMKSSQLLGAPDHTSGGRVPDVHRAIQRGRGDPAAIRRPCQRMHLPGGLIVDLLLRDVPLIAEDRRASGGVPDAHLLIGAARGDQFTIGRPANADDRRLVIAEGDERT